MATEPIQRIGYCSRADLDVAGSTDLRRIRLDACELGAQEFFRSSKQRAEFSGLNVAFPDCRIDILGTKRLIRRHSSSLVQALDCTVDLEKAIRNDFTSSENEKYLNLLNFSNFLPKFPS